MINGQRMLVSFHGSHDIGREVADGGGALGGGEARSGASIAPRSTFA